MCRTRSLQSFYSVLVFFALPLVAAAQRGVLLPSDPPPSHDRLALVIGNGDYSTASLRNATNDARAMGRRLSELGFSVDLQINSDRRKFDQALEDFIRRITPGSVALFYYAGHGAQFEGENFLFPTDFKGQRESDIKYDAESADQIESRLEHSPAAVRILIFDACRNNPFGSNNRSLRSGLAAMNPARGTFVAFATAPGSTADDEGPGDNGLFTYYLLKGLARPGLNITELLDWVREQVDTASHGRQTPWSLSALVGRFQFVPDDSPAETAGPAAEPAPARLPDQKQLAVLPFRNVGNVPSNQALCDGLHEVLTSMLTTLDASGGKLHVVPASEVLQQQVTSVEDARRRFGVNLVLTGSVQRVADQLWITTNLVDVPSERQLQTRTLKYDAADLATVHEKVMNEMAGMLQFEAQPRAASARVGTTVPEANLDYLQASGLLYREDKAGNLDQAIERLEAALRLDPAFGDAGIALCIAYQRKYTATGNALWLQRARSAAERISPLAPRVAGAQVAIGMVNAAARQHTEALPRFQAAIRLDPQDSSAYRELAGSYAALGRIDEAEATLRRAVAISPNDWLNLTILAAFCRDHQRYREALSWFEQVRVLTPDSPLVYRNLGAVRAELGDYDNAVKDFHQSVSLQPTPAGYSNLGAAYILLHRYAEAIPVLERGIRIANSDYARLYMLWLNLGDAYRWWPETLDKAPDAYRQAITGLEKLLQQGPRDAQLHALAAACRAKIQDREQARAEITKALDLAPSDATVRYYAALVAELAGGRDEALAQIRIAVERGYSVSRIQDDPELKQLIADARYGEIVRKFKSQ
jgi:tetratricopeptide (TPR) repeat protein/TolB-like protein